MSKVFRISLLLVLVLSFGASAVAPTSAQGPKVIRATVGVSGTNIIFDVGLATDNVSLTFIDIMFPGLAPQNESTNTPEKGLAESWETAEDGITWTFKVREDVPWVKYDAEAGEVVQVTDENGDVRYVTAHDFAYGALRTMNPETASNYGYLPAGWVEGGNAFNGGDGMAEGVMIEALDDYTLQITSPEPAAFAILVYGMWVFAAQPQWAIEEYGDAWTLVGNYPTYGNFTLKEYEPGTQATMIKNPFWPGTESHPVSALDEIQILQLDHSAALAAYEAGEVDFVDAVPLPDLDRVKVEYPGEYVNGAQDGIYYYGFNVEKEPFDNVHARRAFSAAIDRQTLIDAVTKGGQIPAGFFSSPNFAAGALQEDYPDLGVRYDPEVAAAELELYFEETGNTFETMPEVTLWHNTSESHALIAQAIQQMWKQNLGVEVQITNQEWQVYLDTLTEDPPQVWRLGWGADYPDPHNFLNDVMRSDSGNNHTMWGNEEFDQLLDEAKVMFDFDARIPLYARAEHILTWEDCAIAPIYFSSKNVMVSPNLVATISSASTERYDKWDLK